ncbi:hypothetical protein H4R99_002136 [Coemansia sp. RSA 1722]|nr:hypothetical protein LPJ57_003256 [Coemansia sp. RSA 486]KAJ2603941.1 hypothetical protein H4R99_002136 [Coemansia sp. RSA 1722]
MHSLFRRSQAIRTNHARRQRPTWEERARAALAAARDVEESSGESVPTRPSEVNVSRRLCYGPRYILPGSQSGASDPKSGNLRWQQQQHEAPCDVLQSNVALDTSSLQVSSVMMETAQSPNAVTQSPFYMLVFTVDALVPTTVNLHWLATEEWDMASATTHCCYPRFASRVSMSRSYSLDAGCGQHFALPRPDWLEPSEEPYRTLLSSDWQARNRCVPSASTAFAHGAAVTAPDVTAYPQSPANNGGSSAPSSDNGIELDVLQQRDNEIQELSSGEAYKAPAYGLIIELVERRHKDKECSTLGPNEPVPTNSQISYIDFYKEGNSLVIPRCVKQKVCIDGALFVQHEIFGLKEAMHSRAHARNDDQLQCAICLSDDRDTVLLPCRHMCMCRECANTYRQQSNKCPICRTVVETILHIQETEADQPASQPNCL